MSDTPFSDAFLNLSLAFDAMQVEVGHVLIPSFERLLDVMVNWNIVKARYRAANKQGLVLALFIIGASIL